MSEFEPVPPPPVVGPGRMLSQLREERRLSVSDVAQHLKYGVKQIEALEAEAFGRLPGSTFVRGMVRSYAKLLETDPQRVLNALDKIYSPGEVSLDLRARQIPFPQGGKRGTRTYLLLSVFVLIVAGVAYEWRAGAFPWARLVPTGSLPLQEAPAPVTAPPDSKLPAAPSVAPAPEPKTPAAATPAAAQTQALSKAPSAPPPREGRIGLEFDGESWVEIREQDGKMLMSQLNSAGSRKVVVGHPPLSLVIGNAAAVRLTYNDIAVDLKPYVEIEVARLTLE
ncbi:MAG: helix-turn-helix domain-containing protein [Burkholderiales bacterium]